MNRVFYNLALGSPTGSGKTLVALVVHLLQDRLLKFPGPLEPHRNFGALEIGAKSDGSLYVA